MRSAQFRQAAFFSPSGNALPRAGFVFQKFDELRECAAELVRRGVQVSQVIENDLQCFRDQRGEVRMLGTDGNPAVWTTLPPEFRRCGFAQFTIADFQREIHPQPFERVAGIIRLAAPFRRLTFDPRGAMLQNHRGFGLIPMLAPRPAPPSRPQLTLLQQLSVRQQDGMQMKPPCSSYPSTENIR